MIQEYIKNIKIGDWFVLYQMSKNLNRGFFYQFLIALAKEHQCNANRPRHLENIMIETGLLDEPDLAKIHEAELKKSKEEKLTTTNTKDTSTDTEELNKTTKSSTADEPPPLMEDSPRTVKSTLHDK